MKWLIRWWRKFLGWSDCPVCQQQTMCWIKDPVFHPEEPPCFGHWQCHNLKCLVRSDIEATSLMDEAARKHGYADFQDFAKKGTLK